MDGDGHASDGIRSSWTLEEVRALHRLPFADLMHRAQSVHRLHFDPNAVQVSTLLSIKTGACPEDCAYCPQDRKSTRLNSSHSQISYAVFCLKKKKKKQSMTTHIIH